MISSVTQKTRLGPTCLITRNNATPERDICPALALGSLLLEFQILQCGCWRDGVERHIYERGHTARDRRPSPGPKSFPVRPSWLVEMNVCTN